MFNFNIEIKGFDYSKCEFFRMCISWKTYEGQISSLLQEKNTCEDRISCKTEMSHFSQLYNWILLSTIPLKSSKYFWTTMQTVLPSSSDKYYWTVIQKTWNHSLPFLPIMAYCLHGLIKVLWVFTFANKRKQENWASWFFPLI